MKKIDQLLKSRDADKKMVLDEKTIFYIFGKIIEEEYGKKGVSNFFPVAYKGKKLFIKSPSSSWKNELWLNKGEILRKVNLELGGTEILDIKFN